MHYLKYLFLFIISCYMLSVSAQSKNKSVNKVQTGNATSQMLSAYIDSLTHYREKQLDTMNAANIAVSVPDIFTPENRYYRLFIPFTFYHSPARRYLRLTADSTAENGTDALIDRTLLNIYLTRPDLVGNSETHIRQVGSVEERFDTPVYHNIDMVKKVAPQPVEQTIETPVKVVVMRPNFWTYKGDYYLQFLQNYVSSNWYKSGESNYSMVGSAMLQANYNNKQKVKWDNKLEMKIGFQTSRADSLHSMKTTEDLLRYTSKLGLQASKRWYYTLQLVAYTQFARGYKSNDATVYSDIFSPLNINLSLGMDYSTEWLKKRLTGNIHIAPLAYNLRYVDRLALSTRYGLDAGKHVMHDFGSEFTIDLIWKFNDMISWQTRLYGYTTYSRAELEWENTISFRFNRYISTNLFVYPRFDDGSNIRTGNHGYWQLKEYASIGFAYSF